MVPAEDAPETTPPAAKPTGTGISPVPDRAQDNRPTGVRPAADIGPQAVLPSPATIFEETFENGSGAIPWSLTNYPGTNGVRYTASQYWLDTGFCNGFITSAIPNLSLSQIQNTYCGLNGDPADQRRGDYDAVRVKAQALGVFAQGGNGQNNRALSTNTSGGTPNAMMFQTVNNNIQLPSTAQNRFYAFSVDAAMTYAEPEVPLKPEMYFYLTRDGNTPRLLNDQPLPVATGQRFDYLGQSPVNSTLPWASQGIVGRYYSNAFLMNGGQIGLRLDNRSTASSNGCGTRGVAVPPPNPPGIYCPNGGAGTANGNDGAIDNIRLTDVSPVTEKTFSPARLPVGQTSVMTITVRNRSDLGRKEGWAFTDTLPAGLSFANTTVGGTCTGSKSVNTATRQLIVSNGVLEKGQENCTLTASVTSSQAATFSNGGPNGNFGNLVGIDPPSNAQVTFYPLIALRKDVVSRTNAADQFTLTIAPQIAGATNTSATTTGTATGVQAQLAGPVELVPGATYRLSEAGAAGADLTDYATSLSCVDTANGNGPVAVTALPGVPGSYSLVAPAIPTGGSRNLVCTFRNQTLPNPTLTLVKQVVNPAAGTGYAAPTDWRLTATGSGTAQGSIVQGVTGAAQVTQQVVPAGPYRLSEAFTAAPDKSAGYDWTGLACTDANGDDIGFTRTEAGGVVSAGSIVLERTDEVTCTFTNTPRLGAVTWTKVDPGGRSLAGAEWTLTGPGSAAPGSPVADCVAAPCGGPDTDPRPGFFRVQGLPWGEHTLTETKPPAGFRLDAAPRVFRVGAGGTLSLDASLGAIANTPRVAPALPFTGDGLGRDVFFIVGLGAVALGLGAAVTARIRARRREAG
ncbi:MAG: SpaA isopeptide-forming pilin-related protein [Micropruina sp.]|uniref:DUF7933 domain-containing protein n=1 Tax=Micropruina sp. TaxID=2737536 RepID=UPI0039E685BC